MKAKDLSKKQRWFFGSIGVLAVAVVVGAIAIRVPAPRLGRIGSARAPASLGSISTSLGTFKSYSHVARRSKNSPSACRAAGGVCVGLEPGACARGPVGNATNFSCGRGDLQCCLPEGRYDSVGNPKPSDPEMAQTAAGGDDAP
jgi:hypothetical protein